MIDNLEEELMAPKKAINETALLAELDLHKTEFSALRDEILQLIESERQYLNLSLVAFGAGVGLAPFLSNQKTYIILLLFPLVFHVLLWEMLKAVKAVRSISDYLMVVLIPKVNGLLDGLGREDQDIHALGWELHINAQQLKAANFIESSLTPTRHWIPILAIGGLLIAYLVIVQEASYIPSAGEFLLIILNLVLLLWAGFQNIIVMRSTSKKRSKRK